MSLESLPAEIFQAIIDLVCEHPPTLLNLIYVNKLFCAWCLPVAKTTIFHDVRLALGPRNLRHRVVKPLLGKLERAQSFGHVRRLILADGKDKKFQLSEWQPPTFSDLRCSPRGTYTIQYAGLEEEPPELFDDWFTYLGLDDGFEREDVWQPVADLIRQLPALTDVVYRCYAQFPSCLLDAIHETLPRCRIHLQLFRLHSLSAPTLDPRELRLVTSPALHRITAYCIESGGYEPDGSVCYQEDALLRVLALARNLKEVTVIRLPCRHQERGLSDDPPPWQWIPQNGDDSSRPLGTLRKLRIFDGPMIKGSTLCMWGQHTDLSVLEVLEITSRVEAGALDLWMNIPFQSLRSLSLDITPTSTSARIVEEFESAAQFLCQLPPLSSLCLAGWRMFIPVDSIARAYGSRLRKLRLPWTRWQYVTRFDIHKLVRNCPLLEDLTLTIRRSEGDANEVALYRALGAIRNLKHLDLTLDVSPMELCNPAQILTSAIPPERSVPGPMDSPSHPSFDDFDNEFCDENLRIYHRARNGHVRQLLVNSVVDENLARAIFQTIVSANPANRSSLQRLELSVKGISLDHYYAWMLVELFSTNWVIDRDLLSGELAASADVGRYLMRGIREIRATHLQPWLQPIFRRIWPGDQRARHEEDRGPGAWWRDCYGLPLCTDS